MIKGMKTFENTEQVLCCALGAPFSFVSKRFFSSHLSACEELKT